MMLEIARIEDLEAICALYESTCAQMQGLNQWSWGEYPSRDIVREDLEAKGYTFVSAEVEMVPDVYSAIEDPESVVKMEKLLDVLEDNDDVQNVWHNWDQE